MGLKDVLADDLPEEELEKVITSFDIVGDIAIVKVPEELEHRTGVIADGVMEQHPNVRTVIRKTGEREGEYRVADYEVLRGDSTETTHKEHGCRFRLDPTNVYFSERLGHERQRVVAQADPGERALDMFAGVGPFAIMLARNADAAEVLAIEKNPVAADYLRENVDLNGVEDAVEPVEGDAAEVLAEREMDADRIVMNLPGSSEEFVDDAVRHAAEGATVHFYSFEAKDDLDGTARERVAELFREAGVEPDVAEPEICGHYNPAVERVCFDVHL